MSASGDGVNLVECSKCGDKYNAAIPTPHVCGPCPPSSSGSDNDDDDNIQQAVVQQTVPTIAQPTPCGVNMTRCSKCGVSYNAALPPSHRQCGCNGPKAAPISVLVREPQEKGVNMTRCSKCGVSYNAALPPSHRQCGCNGPKFVERGAGPPQAGPAVSAKKRIGSDSDSSDLDLDKLDLVFKI
jgi:hypothetical protein